MSEYQKAKRWIIETADDSTTYDWLVSCAAEEFDLTDDEVDMLRRDITRDQFWG